MDPITGGPIEIGFSNSLMSNSLASVSSKSNHFSHHSNLSSRSALSNLDSGQSSARFAQSSRTFSHTNDISAILRNHPAYMELSGDEFDAIVAGVASTLLFTGGLVLAHVSGGTIVVLASIVLTSAGGTGLVRSCTGYIEGRFDWQELVVDTLTTATVSLITFGTGYFISSCVSYLCLKHSLSLTTLAMEKIATVTGAIAGSVTQGSAYALISHVKDHEIETFELILECVTGAFVGARAGKLAFHGELKPYLRGERPEGWKKVAYNPKPLEFKTPGGESVKVFTTPETIVGSDFHSLETQFRNATRSRLVLISGTHGTPSGATALDSLHHADPDFFRQDFARIREFLSTSKKFFRKRTIEVLNLADFRGEGELLKKLTELQPDTIVGAFCYADKAMKNGKLGEIIRQALKAYRSP